MTGRYVGTLACMATAFILLMPGVLLLDALVTPCNGDAPLPSVGEGGDDCGLERGRTSASCEGALVTVEAFPEPVVGGAGEVVDVTFTFREHDKAGAFIDTYRLWFETPLGEELPSTAREGSCDLEIEAMSASDLPLEVAFSEEMVREATLLAMDKLVLRASFHGFDGGLNPLDLDARVPAMVRHKVALVVDEDVFELTRDKLRRYQSDVNGTAAVEFVEVVGKWADAESLRDDVTDLWRDDGVSGVILVGHLPYAAWEILHSDGKVESCPLPTFYEDLDATFRDTDGNGFYDHREWGDNDGPEIWAAHIMPPRELVPSSNLDPSGSGLGGGLSARYYTDHDFRGLALSRVDEVIDFTWEADCPAEVGEPDAFSVKWTGSIRGDSQEDYTLGVMSGGGVRVFVDGMKVLDRWHNPPWKYWEFVVDGLDLGGRWHSIRIEYNENGWGLNYTGRTRLYWSSDSIVASSVNDYLDRLHSHYLGELVAPGRALLFMDNCYGNVCKMMGPVRDKHLEPLYNGHLVQAGGNESACAGDYLALLDDGYELTSVWSHAGSAGHWMPPAGDTEGFDCSADTFEIVGREASTVTLIWGCHAGDYGHDEAGMSKLSENLAVNYAFSTHYGLAAAGCTRSYYSTFDNVYWGWQNQSYLGLGFYAFVDRDYDHDKRVRQYGDFAEDTYVGDFVLVGDPFIRIDHRPRDLDLAIGDGGLLVDEREVILKVTATEADEVRFRNGDGRWSAWMPFAPEVAWTLSEGLGGKLVRMQARNGYWTSREEAAAAVTLVTTFARSASLSINGGDECTNSSRVRLDLEAEGADVSALSMRISSGTGFWSDWMPFSSPLGWEMDGRDGTRTVEVELVALDGLWWTSVRDSIVLDTEAPSVQVVTVADEGREGWYLSSASVDVTAIDETTGVAEVTYSLDGAPWTEWTGPVVIDGDGIHVLRCTATDGAGNRAAERVAEVRIDTTAPVDVALRIGDGSPFVNTTDLTLTVLAEDPTSGLNQMRLFCDGGEWSPWIPYARELPYGLPDVQGAVSVRVQVRDAAGNVATQVGNASVVVDTVRPSMVEATPDDGNTGVGVDASVLVGFDEPLDPSSVTNLNVSLVDGDGDVVDAVLQFLATEADHLRLVPVGPLEHLTTYTVVLGAGVVDAAGNHLDGGPVLRWTFTTLGVPPTHPTDVVASWDGNVTLTWAPPGDVGSGPFLGYKVYRTVHGGDGATDWLSSGEDTTYLDTAVEPDTTYVYTIVAFNAVGQSEAVEVTVTVPRLDVQSPTGPSDGPAEETLGGETVTEPPETMLPLVVVFALVAAAALATVLLRRGRA